MGTHAPLKGASNEYQQQMFWWRNMKNIVWVPPQELWVILTCVPSLLVTLTFNSSTDVHIDKYNDPHKDKTMILFINLQFPLNRIGSLLHSLFLAATAAEKRAERNTDSDPFTSHGTAIHAPRRGHLADTFWLPMLLTKYTPVKIQ